MATPFDSQPLTPAQQQEVIDRAKATAVLSIVNVDIADTKAQLGFIYDAWVAASQPLPAQPPLDPKIPLRESLAAQYWYMHDVLNALIAYRGAVLGWKLNAGQPNHPKDMPVLTIPPDTSKV